jgi:hypothetical protein
MLAGIAAPRSASQYRVNPSRGNAIRSREIVGVKSEKESLMSATHSVNAPTLVRLSPAGLSRLVKGVSERVAAPLNPRHLASHLGLR